MVQDIERRAIAGLELREAGDGKLPTIEGYAAVFGKRSEELLGFQEEVKKGAFKRTLKDGADVRALVGHDPNMVLGRNTAGTLRVKEDRVGLKVEIDPPDTQVARDTVESIRRGDIDGMSFGFKAATDNWRTIDGVQIRVLEDVDLFDVSVVTFPAYPDTSVGLRSLESWQAEAEAASLASQTRERRLRLMELGR